MSGHLDLLWYAAEWAIRLGALAVVPQRRSPSSAAAWLLLLFFLPVPGLVLFLLIGSPRFPAWRLERFRSLAPFIRQGAEALAKHPSDLEGREPMAALAQRLGGLPATAGNRVEVIDIYDDLFDRLVADIDAAAVSVHLLVYIFADDAVGRRIASALGRAVARGLDVRVMFDPVGSHAWRRGTLAMLRDQGVDVREALPWRFLHWRLRKDMRNHRKLFVIDGRIGYAGSQNLVAKDFRPGIVNHELVLRVEGPVVAALDVAVRSDWALETGAVPDRPVEVPGPVGSAKVQLLPTGADYRIEGFESLLVWQIHQALKSVILVTPYFIPDEDVIGALRTAVARGVEVHLVVSAVVDQRMVRLAQSSYYEGLLASGVRIHQYRRFLLHAKNVGIDGRVAMVGSSNVDVRSFQLNEEACLLLYDTDTVARIDAVQRGYPHASDELSLAEWRNRPRLARVGENIARLFSALF